MLFDSPFLFFFGGHHQDGDQDDEDDEDNEDDEDDEAPALWCRRICAHHPRAFIAAKSFILFDSPSLFFFGGA